MDDKIIIAVATDDDKNLSNEHFGEAANYLIYEISENQNTYITTVKNISPEEKIHGDPNKAKGVAALLKPHNVKVLINKAFGKNIVRMKQKFVCIISSTDSIEENLSKITQNYETIIELWKQGIERDYLKI